MEKRQNPVGLGSMRFNYEGEFFDKKIRNRFYVYRRNCKLSSIEFPFTDIDAKYVGVGIYEVVSLILQNLLTKGNRFNYSLKKKGYYTP